MTPEQLSKDPANLKLMWEKARKIYKELKVTGLSDIAIAGILGNMAQESSFIPNKKGGSHVGYVQNEPRIINWITLQFGGYDHKHLMNYLIAGLTNKLPDITSVMGSDLNNRFNTFVKGVLKINDIPSAVRLWETSYEKSNGLLLLARINYGNYFYNKILEEGDTLKPQEYGQMYSPQGNLSIYLPTSIENEDSTYAKLTLNNIHEYLLYRQKNLPKIPYKRGYKSGGKLIKKGQQGMLVFRNPNNPYNVEIQLEKDTLPEGYIEPNNIGKYGYYDITPEERMDLTTLLLNERLSTYKPTKEQKRASEGIYHPKRITDWLGLAPVVVPAAIAAGVTLPEWGPAAVATANNPLFWGELLKDTGTYITADLTSKGLTGKGIGAHVNNAIGLEEDHPVGDFTAMTLTPTAKWAIKSLLKKPVELVFTSTEILNDYPHQITKLTLDNGKIRLRLPNHSNRTTRELVLDPLGDNKYFVHVRIWDNPIIGKRTPGKLNQSEIKSLQDALYDTLPEEGTILFPESDIDNPGTRGTLAALLRLQRDPRFFSTGKFKTLWYNKAKKPKFNPKWLEFDRDVNFYIGLDLQKKLSLDKLHKVAVEALDKAKNFLSSEELIQHMIDTGLSRELAETILNEMKNNIDRIDGSTILLVPNLESLGTYGNLYPLFIPEVQIHPVTSSEEINELVNTAMHEIGGHGATMGTLSGVYFNGQTVKDKVLRVFPHALEVFEHNLSLQPQLNEETLQALADENLIPSQKLIDYYLKPEEYSTRARLANWGFPDDFNAMVPYFTSESLQKLRKGVWGLLPLIPAMTTHYKNTSSNENKNK